MIMMGQIDYMQGPLCGQNDCVLEVCVHESCMTIMIEDGPPCPECGYRWDCEGCKAEADYNAYLDWRCEQFGQTLAFLPDEMECYDCGRHLPQFMTKIDNWGMRYMMRRVVGEGPVANKRVDPTSTYRLACGHYAM